MIIIEFMSNGSLDSYLQVNEMNLVTFKLLDKELVMGSLYNLLLNIKFVSTMFFRTQKFLVLGYRI